MRKKNSKKMAERRLYYKFLYHSICQSPEEEGESSEEDSEDETLNGDDEQVEGRTIQQGTIEISVIFFLFKCFFFNFFFKLLCKLTENPKSKIFFQQEGTTKTFAGQVWTITSFLCPRKRSSKLCTGSSGTTTSSSGATWSCFVASTCRPSASSCIPPRSSTRRRVWIIGSTTSWPTSLLYVSQILFFFFLSVLSEVVRYLLNGVCITFFFPTARGLLPQPGPRTEVSCRCRK